MPEWTGRESNQDEIERLLGETERLQAICKPLGLRMFGWNTERDYSVVDDETQVTYQIKGRIADLLKELAWRRAAEEARP